MVNNFEGMKFADRGEKKEMSPYDKYINLSRILASKKLSQAFMELRENDNPKPIDYLYEGFEKYRELSKIIRPKELCENPEDGASEEEVDELEKAFDEFKNGNLDNINNLYRENFPTDDADENMINNKIGKYPKIETRPEPRIDRYV